MKWHTKYLMTADELEAEYPRSKYYYYHPSGLVGFHSIDLYHWYNYSIQTGYAKAGTTKTPEGAERREIGK